MIKFLENAKKIMSGDSYRILLEFHLKYRNLKLLLSDNKILHRISTA